MSEKVSVAETGTFMIAVFSEYVRLVEDLVDYEFACKTEAKEQVRRVSHEFKAQELQHFKSWLCFATTACMHEKVFNDFFKRL